MNYNRSQKKNKSKYELSCAAILVVLFAVIIAGFIV